MRLHFRRMGGHIVEEVIAMTIVTIGGAIIEGAVDEIKKRKSEKAQKSKIQDAEVTIVESEDQNEKSNK